MESVILLSSDGSVSQISYVSKDLVDATLLDLLRGKMSFGNKSFALVQNENENEIVYIEDNVTKWVALKDFFAKIDMPGKIE